MYPNVHRTSPPREKIIDEKTEEIEENEEQPEEQTSKEEIVKNNKNVFSDEEESELVALEMTEETSEPPKELDEKEEEEEITLEDMPMDQLNIQEVNSQSKKQELTENHIQNVKTEKKESNYPIPPKNLEEIQKRMEQEQQELQDKLLQSLTESIKKETSKNQADQMNMTGLDPREHQGETLTNQKNVEISNIIKEQCTQHFQKLLSKYQP